MQLLHAFIFVDLLQHVIISVSVMLAPLRSGNQLTKREHHTTKIYLVPSEAFPT
jgi:hypothetical protein